MPYVHSRCNDTHENHWEDKYMVNDGPAYIKWQASAKEQWEKYFKMFIVAPLELNPRKSALYKLKLSNDWD